jgi:hypothetical protein
MALDPFGLRPGMMAANQARAEAENDALAGVRFKKCGNGIPRFRSSWEVKYAMSLESDPNVVVWFSEPKNFNLRYPNPVTNQMSQYWPDFLVNYADGKTEIVEIKPLKQSSAKFAIGPYDKIEFLKNTAKWAVAAAFAKSQGWGFKVLTERNLFTQAAKKTRKPRGTNKPRGTVGTRGTR